jgi:hypothetical protein
MTLIDVISVEHRIMSDFSSREHEGNYVENDEVVKGL